MQPEDGLGPDTPLPRCRSADRVMWVTPDRLLYVGLLGAPSVRTMGATVIYVALEGRLHIGLAGGDWAASELAVVQPYVAHRIACDARHIAALYVEPETVDSARLPSLLRQPSGAVDDAGFARRVRCCHARLAAGRGLVRDPDDFDRMVFGSPLAASTLDPRIAAVVGRIKRDPSAQAGAAECAAEARLSFSRFLHLFKEEVGAPFRSFRTWQRARSLLHYVHAPTNLTNVALDVGYPDSTHFSHSIRQVYGLTPKDIFAGSRKLRVIARSVSTDGAPALA